MKISRLEFVALLLAAVFAAFAAGWFFGAGRAPARAGGDRAYPDPGDAPGAARAYALPLRPEQGGYPAYGAKINLNTAGVDELMTLPGIGEKRAEDIIAYRQANGPFRIPEELTEVPGIGEGILEGLIDYVTTGEENR
ncbi:ComEA family DNA-binding protein [Flavonifractor plautii]|nr:ComEA family DNA-binding protein [Flavonifractor plautii]